MSPPFDAPDPPHPAGPAPGRRSDGRAAVPGGTPPPGAAGRPGGAVGAARVSVPPPGIPQPPAGPPTGELRAAPADGRDPRSGRMRRGSVEAGAPVPADGTGPVPTAVPPVTGGDGTDHGRRPGASTGRRRAAEADAPPVPRSGNAPPVPRSGNAPPVPGAPAAPPGVGVQPPGGPAPRGRRAVADNVEIAGRGRRTTGDDEASGRARHATEAGQPAARRADDTVVPPPGRPAVPDEVESPAHPPRPVEGETGRQRQPGDSRAGRPERPADWLRQAGRAHHTDPALPTVKRSVPPPVAGGPAPTPPAVEQRGVETGPAPTGRARPGAQPPRPTDTTETGQPAGRARPGAEPPRAA
ncbi:hypothetical protein ABT346_11930, partial [Micromonospora peucetia]